MPKANRGGWKTCSRGHKYRGEFCPKCMPGRAQRSAAPEPLERAGTTRQSGSPSRKKAG
jgi:hypothetical protein